MSCTNRSLILISVAVTLSNEKVIRLKREKIQLRKVAKIDRHLYLQGGEGEEQVCAQPPPYKRL